MATVLVVDDFFGTLTTVKRLLRNHNTYVAQDLPGAMDQLRRHRPDVVVIDVILQNGDNGLDLLEAIKRERPHTVVVTMTASIDKHFMHASFASGADGFVQKEKLGQLPSLLHSLLYEQAYA